jgi:hypothetical protein
MPYNLNKRIKGKMFAPARLWARSPLPECGLEVIIAAFLDGALAAWTKPSPPAAHSPQRTAPSTPGSTSALAAFLDGALARPAARLPQWTAPLPLGITIEQRRPASHRRVGGRAASPAVTPSPLYTAFAIL